MQQPKTGVVLLILMLAAMAIVPMVSATAEADTDLTASISGNLIDVDKIALPKLMFDETQQKVVVTTELSPTGTRGLQAIPKGAIIHHAENGITTVFDRDGQQVLLADDKESSVISTPSGLKHATYVTEVPTDSQVINKGKVTYVTNGKDLILTVICENVTQTVQNEHALNQKSGIAAATLSNFNGWIEYAYDNMAQIRQFDAYWTVPSSPPSSESAEPVFLFNAIRTYGETAIVQPVLEWNQPSTGLYWTGSSWALKDGMQAFKTTRITASTSDTMKGRLYWYSATGEWYIQIYDVTNGQYRSLYSNYVPDSNVQVDVTLEGWGIDDNSDVPGDTLFYNMVYKYNGNPVPVVLKRFTSTSAPLTQLNVEILSNPSSVKLHTAN
ncbi:MAG: hypothetical protein WC586_11820 [Methanoregula sp.]